MNVYTKKQNILSLRIFMVIGVVLILLVFLNVFQAKVRNYFYAVSSPLNGVFWKVGNDTSGFLGSFKSYTKIIQQNANLTRENQTLLSQITLLQDALKGSQVYQQALTNAKINDFAILPVQTIGLDSSSDVILINKGQDNGIKDNMPVVSAENVLYGKVSNVYENFSKVMLISNTNSVVDVKIPPNDQTKAPVYGAVRGKGNLSVYLDLVSSDAQIKEGDLLVTSALEGIFPKNLLVGNIVTQTKDDLK